MAQITIKNNDDGLAVRDSLNDMFGELYAGMPIPIRIPGVTGNTQQAILANTLLASVSITSVSGNPVVRVGTTINGSEISNGDIAVNGFNKIEADQYFTAAGTVYFTFSGQGKVNLRLDVLLNYH